MTGFGADTWANSLSAAGPTLDDIFDLRGRAEIDAYVAWAEDLGLDEWATVTFDLWVTERPEPEAPDDSKWVREGR